MGPWLTSESRGVGGVDTAGSVRRGLETLGGGWLRPFQEGARERCAGVYAVASAGQAAGGVGPWVLPTEHPPHRSLRGCWSAALPQAGLSVASSGAHRDTGP